MAIIPLRQTITVKPASATTDRFNRPTMGAPISLKCRVVDSMKLVKTRSSGDTVSAEAVSSAQIYLDKLAAIGYDDEISYTNELGITITRKPLSIEIKRGLGGKAILTVVYI